MGLKAIVASRNVFAAFREEGANEGSGAAEFRALQTKREMAVRLRNRGCPLYRIFALAAAGLERTDSGSKSGIIIITMTRARTKMMTITIKMII